MKLIWANMKQKITSLSLLLLFIVTVNGCKSPDWGYSKPYDFASQKVRKHNYVDGSFRRVYDQAKAANDDVSARRERNQILGELMYIIDADHGDYERSMQAHATAFEVMSDFTVLGLTGAGAVTGGAETKAILSAIASGVMGAQLSVNKRVFRDKTIEALQAQMRAAQTQRKAEIISRMKQTTDDYTLELGLSDIVQYYYDGTMTRALQNMVADAKEKEKKAESSVSANLLLLKASPVEITTVEGLTDQLGALVKNPDQAAARAEAQRILKALDVAVDPKETNDQLYQKLQDQINTAATNHTLLPKLSGAFAKP
jgi:hypothetical protein